MGGRGAGSGNAGGIKRAIVRTNGITIEYEKINGSIYRIANGIPEKVNTTLSMSEMVERMKSTGADVQTYNAKQDEELKKKRKKDRKETDRILNRASVSDRTFVKGSRSSRITDRANKRKRR